MQDGLHGKLILSLSFLNCLVESEPVKLGTEDELECREPKASFANKKDHLKRVVVGKGRYDIYFMNNSTTLVYFLPFFSPFFSFLSFPTAASFELFFLVCFEFHQQQCCSWLTLLISTSFSPFENNGICSLCLLRPCLCACTCVPASADIKMTLVTRCPFVEATFQNFLAFP